MNLQDQFKGIIAPAQLEYTADRLKAVIGDFMEADAAVEASYKDRGDLMARRVQLETEIKLDESDALMQIEGEGKTAFAMVGDKKVVMSNEQVRDAYRRTYTRKQREELATVDAQLARIDVDVMKSKDRYKTAADAADSLKAVANVQASLLTTLGKVTA